MGISHHSAEFDGRRAAMAAPAIVTVFFGIVILLNIILFRAWPLSLVDQIIGAFCLVIMVQMLIFIYAVAFTRKPGLIVSDEGISLRACYETPIPWSEISGARIRLYWGYLPALELRSESDSGFSVAPTKLRTLIRFCFLRPYSLELIDISKLEPSPGRLAEAIERYMPVEDSLGEKAPFVLERGEDGITWKRNPMRRKVSRLGLAVLWIALVLVFMFLITKFQ